MASANGKRPLHHAKVARRSSKDKPLWVTNWVRKLQAEGRDYSVLVLEELSSGSPRAFVGFVEKCYIEALRKVGHRLTNIAEGGWSGYSGPPSVEVRAKISATLTGRKNGPPTAETREKIRQALAGRSLSSDQKAKLSVRQRASGAKPPSRVGISHSPEARAKIGEASKRQVYSAERRAKMGASMRGKTVSVETRAKISAALKGRLVQGHPHTAEARAKMRAAWKKKKEEAL
jgi:hypothetical protein